MNTQLSVARLAQYRPFEHDGLNSRAALVDLVLAAALEADGQVRSLRECQDNCKTLWGLDVELDELREILDGMVAAGSMSRSNGHFTLDPAKAAELAERVRASELVEKQAFEDWEVTLRVVNPGLTEEDVAQLRDDLVVWLEQLIKRHGVESALILYPEIPRAQQLFAEIDGEGIDFLPRRFGRVGEIREQALYLFVRQPTEAQRTMLATLLNTAYFVTILSLDPSAGALVQELTRGQRIYLDTNFVYRVLNLQGPLLHLSAKRLLELTQKLGYETAVTPWTVREMKESLERARDFLMKQPLPPAELAELAAAATTDENFVTAYWIRLKEHPVSPKDFYEFYAQIEDHLAALENQRHRRGEHRRRAGRGRDQRGNERPRPRARLLRQARRGQAPRRQAPSARPTPARRAAALLERGLLVPDLRQRPAALRPDRVRVDGRASVLRDRGRLVPGDALVHAADG